MVGKWHLGYCDERMTPTFRGFDSFLGYLNGAEEYFAHTRAASGFDALDFRVSALQSAEMFPPPSNASYGKYSTEVFTTRMAEIVKDHVTQYGVDGKPLFVYLPFQSVHGPLEAPQKYIDMYEDAIQNLNRRTNAGMVTALDIAVGMVEQTYKSHGLWESTVLIFTTDNGGFVHDDSANNFPLRGFKNTNWEGGIKGNAFVRGATGFEVLKGTVTRQLMHSTDWMPTLAAIAGASTSRTLPLDGHNVWPVLSKGANTTRNSIMINCPAAGEKVAGAYRSGDFKLLYDGMQTKANTSQYPPPGFQVPGLCPNPESVNGTWLFNIAEDPQECHNLADKSEYAATLKTMEQEFATYQKTAVPDIALAHDMTDPASDPSLRADKAWGPFTNSKQCKFTCPVVEQYFV